MGRDVSLFQKEAFFMMAPLCKGQRRKPHPNHGSLVQRELSAQLTEGLSVRIPIPRKNAVGSTLPRRLSGFSPHSITPPDKFSTADGFCKHNAIPREKYFLFLRFFYITLFIFPRRKQKKAQKKRRPFAPFLFVFRRHSVRITASFVCGK